MKEKKNPVITFLYGQPFSLVLVLLFGILGIILFALNNPYGIIPMFDTFLIYGIYLYLLYKPSKINKNLKIFYIHKHVFIRGFAVINQRGISKKPNSYECPNAQVKEELEYILEEMPGGSVYTCVTHEAVIALMKSTNAVQNGKVTITKLPYYKHDNLARMKRDILNSNCRSCNKALCGTKDRSEGKDIRKFYAVSIKKSK